MSNAEGPAAVFARRRQKIADRMAQLKRDTDSWNENRRRADEEPIVIVMDLTEDVAELEAAEEPEAVKGAKE